MDYDTIAAAYLTPMADPPAAPSLGTSPARRLRDALEPIATQGWWSRPPHARLAALGLGFFPAYVWGRAAALGDGVPAAVVVATFGVFEPGLLAAVYEEGRAAASRDAVIAARADGASEAMAALVDGVDVAPLADALLDAVLPLAGTARPLFSALRSLPLPSTPPGRLWRAAELVREHRGDGHLAACIAAGLDPIEMNVLTERWIGYALSEYSGTRGYGLDAIGAAVARLGHRGWMASDATLTPAGRAARDAIEDATDASQAALVAALGDRLDGIVADAASISARIVAAGSFPADPRKAAAG